MTSFSRADAERRDAGDPLRSFVDRFVVADDRLVYVDGNSLGRLPRATAGRLERFVREEWGGALARGWDRWVDVPFEVGDLLGAEVLGAATGQVVVADSTTVNLYKLAVAALAHQRNAAPERTVIVTDRTNFPTDRYVLEGVGSVRWVDGADAETVAEACAAGDVALVSFQQVDYRTARIADVRAIDSVAHAAGALTLWDLSHAAGAVPVELDQWGCDLAVGCTYKYLCAGPGAPAFLYVRDELQDALRQPIRGWFGQTEQFEMERDWRPRAGIGAFLSGTPPVAAIEAVRSGVELVAEAGMHAVRRKSVALTSYAVDLFDAWLAPVGCELGSPRASADRGSHVSIRHPDAERLTADLMVRGVVPDHRPPDVVRIGLSPLSARFTDVFDALSALRDLLSRG